MLSKFRLDRRNKYECRLLILKLAEMLEGVASAVPHAIEIGSEQGGIPHWDDIVEIRCDGTILHTQVKRQSTDFNSSSPTRPSRSSELSVLDSALESLARSIDREDLDASGKRFFELMVFGPGILVKKGIRIEQFDEIVTLFSTNSISCEKMADRQDAAKEAVFQWLTTWCGFRDWAHISMVLSRLSIKFCGTEVEVDSRTMGSLAKIFKDPSAAKDSLSTYVFDEASDVGAISSRAMMKHLKHLLRPDVPSWTQYRKVGGVSCWELSGIHDLEDQDAERATGVVASLWGTDGQRRILQLHAPHTSMDVSKIALPHAILRLALHLNGASQCLLEDASAWKTKAGDLTGQTIGCSASDLTNLPWAESQPRPGAPMRHLAGISESSAEATSLMHAMDERVRSQLKSRVNDSLERVMDEELQSELANL